MEKVMANELPIIKEEDKALVEKLRTLIEAAKHKVAVTVNSAMTMLYWEIGTYINSYILDNKRAEYGKQIVVSLSRQLQQEYGTNFSEKNLRRMMQFAERFPEKGIVVSLIRQLTWTHIIALIPLEDELKRNFYIEMCQMEHWSVRTLRKKIDSMLYERTAISKKPEETIQKELSLLQKEQLSPDMVFRDPYILDFLGLHDTYSEKDLEDAIIAELQQFICELGADFAFLSRQKRITIDNEDYYIDLLFFHRRLRCLVAIDLKLGSFKASYKGQMELYLNWLKKNEMVEGENQPIGLILCAGKNEEHIELMHLEESNIRVAEYLVKLPDRNVLENKLQMAIERAKHRLASSANTVD
jgi:predicted nuclease of restriction endonuclease-like (RecB) superfamily